MTEVLSSKTYTYMGKRASFGFVTTFPVAPGMLTFINTPKRYLAYLQACSPTYCSHRVEIPSTNSHDYASWSTGKELTEVISPSDQLIFKFLVSGDRGPLYCLPQINAVLSGIYCVFKTIANKTIDYLDCTLMSGPIVEPLYPSIESLNVGDQVATFGYNGTLIYSFYTF